MAGEKKWSYKNLDIDEGLKPGSKHFQYFFVVSEKGKKKCNYCVWIDDENLTHFTTHSKEFEKIVSLKGKEWRKWVQGKIDQRDFRNLVLKLEKNGQQEIDLSEMEKKLKLE
jgi:sulfatase maturation enzyme AslB (radical SAM superfamily)